MVVIDLHREGIQESVDHIQFPTGERHIRIRNLWPTDSVFLKYSDPSGDLMKLGMAVDICRRAQVKSITLLMTFTPYARQDQVYVPGDPLSIKVFADFVNSLNLDKVIVIDPHSNVTSALFNNCLVVPQSHYAKQAVLKDQPDVLVAPDLGAAKKIKDLQRELNDPIDIIQCDKTRDPRTGKITGFRVLDGDPRGKRCMMVDDICDGGGTFLGLAEVLAAKGATSQSLYVTHGIFSRGLGGLVQAFDKVYTTDSLPIKDGTEVISLGDLR